MAYVKAIPPSVVYHLTRMENLDSVLDDGKIRRFMDSECWFCESLGKMKAYMEQTVMCEGKPYYAVSGQLCRYPKFVPEDYVLLKLTPCGYEDNWYRWNQEIPPGSPKELVQAAKAAQCDAFVSKLPEGYHTLIGENGSRLSGGERQRISIARAILKDAPVILLDEATASLDVENETAAQAALSGLIKDKTVLIIAHRMRTVMNADQIVLLSGGRVVEMGSPAELLKKNGLFRHMAQLQSESMAWTA